MQAFSREIPEAQKVWFAKKKMWNNDFCFLGDIVLFFPFCITLDLKQRS
jgi:hypothetical protein